MTSNLLIDPLLVEADAVTDFQEEVVDTSGAAPWFPMLRNGLGRILGGTSKLKVTKVTPNSATFKFRAMGLILDYQATMRLAVLSKQEPNLEFAIFMASGRLYLLVVEREHNG